MKKREYYNHYKRARKTSVRQQDQADCGVACLLSVIRYYGGDVALERLRQLSGTTQCGTSLLGLYEAAKHLGLEVAAYEADINNLQRLTSPCILHVMKPGRLQHFIVCYGYQRGRFIICDPADSVKQYTLQQIETIWRSRALLALEPGATFETVAKRKEEKLSWLFKLVKEDLNILFLALMLGVFISVLSLATAIFSKKLIDEILPDGDLIKLIVGLILLAFLLVARSGLSYLRQLFLIRQGCDFNNRIIRHFFGSLVRLPLSFFVARKTGDLIARMNDTQRLQRAVTYVIGGVMIDVLLLIAAVTFMIYYSVSIGLVALLSVLLFLLLALLFHRPIVEGHKAVMVAHAVNESHYVDTIQGIEVIKTSNTEDRFTATTQAIYGHFQNMIYRLHRVGITFNFWAESIGVLVLVGILGWSAVFVLEKHILLGVLVAIVQMTNLLIPSAKRLALINIELQEALVAFDRMYEFTSIAPEYGPNAAAQKSNIPHLQHLGAHHLTFRFPGQKLLFKDLSFLVKRGEMIAFFGETGSGKTTLLYILQRFYVPESGLLTVNGISLTDLSTKAWRDQIAVVPQHTKLFNGTLVDNICMGNKREQGRDVLAFCREYGFDKYFARFPQGYETLLGETGINVSGGQQKLVALARALYQRPKLLLLDEVTSAMDCETEAYIWEMLKRFRDQFAMIFVTHQIRSAKHADRIYVIEGGRITAEGTPMALLEGNNLFSRAFGDLVLA